MTDRRPLDGLQTETLLAHLGRDPERHFGASNTPVYRASTIAFPTVEAMEEARADRFNRVTYGSWGTPTSYDFEDAVSALEGGHRAISFPTGVAALTCAVLSQVGPGDHILMTDGAYAPLRRLADGYLARNGIEVTFYDPRIGAAIEKLMRPNTRLVYVESPSSHTFELQDIDAIAGAAHEHGALVLCNNSWATPLFFKSFDHGADITVHAATKYIGGHSDLMLGVLVASEPLYVPIRTFASDFGYAVGPDDVYAGLRGLRTLDVRMQRHQDNGLKVARWLADCPQVARVLHPGLPESPDHAVWQRLYRGASGLFAIELKPVSKEAVDTFLASLALFAIGASWGGYESLALPVAPHAVRTAVPWDAPGPLVRLSVGLENADDLIADLERGLGHLSAAASK
ncbi:cystathionine beta-lyase [Acuticoccus kandeliae]|uniref:cystathionine beta-lyase n=1 Tax=Acuticoccus kandeliae TaxID=2073160 RepID=UPI000D3E9745|nr:cystathionine beta-lyase [Acuticoccus kandeliae]